MTRAKAEGLIQVRRDADGYVVLTCIVPGHAGWVVSRATLPEALRALAGNLDRMPSRNYVAFNDDSAGEA